MVFSDSFLFCRNVAGLWLAQEGLSTNHDEHAGARSRLLGSWVCFGKFWKIGKKGNHGSCKIPKNSPPFSSTKFSPPFFSLTQTPCVFTCEDDIWPPSHPTWDSPKLDPHLPVASTVPTSNRSNPTEPWEAHDPQRIQFGSTVGVDSVGGKSWIQPIWMVGFFEEHLGSKIFFWETWEGNCFFLFGIYVLFLGGRFFV